MAALAAVKITREQLAEFQELMDAMRRETEAGADMAKRKFYNNLFHYQIVELCDNKLIESIYSSMMGLISDHISYTDGKDFYKSHLRTPRGLRGAWRSISRISFPIISIIRRFMGMLERIFLNPKLCAVY